MPSTSKPNLRIHLAKNALPGYTLSSKRTDRRNILDKLTKTLGWSNIVKKLNVLYIYNMNKYPLNAAKFRRDMYYIQKKYSPSHKTSAKSYNKKTSNSRKSKKSKTSNSRKSKKSKSHKPRKSKKSKTRKSKISNPFKSKKSKSRKPRKSKKSRQSKPSKPRKSKKSKPGKYHKSRKLIKSKKL
jgi:hypothetical protein